MQPLAVMDQAISRQMDRLATEFNNQAASAVASVRETAEHAQQVLRQEATQAHLNLGGLALEGLATNALNAVDAELYRLDEELGKARNAVDEELGKARNVVQSAVGAVVHDLGAPGGLGAPADRSFTEQPVLRSLPGSSVHRILGRLSRCLDAAAQELGCLALAAAAENTAAEALSTDDLRAQALHAAVSALVTHGSRHSAVALAACDALTALLRNASRAPRPEACDSLLLAAVSSDAASAVAAALSSHTADEGVQAAGLGALLALLALLPRASTPAARDGALAHVVSSQAGDAALSALWTHSGSAGVQAQGAMLMGLLLQHSNPEQTTDLLARGAAQALVAALRGGGGMNGEVAQAACVALLRCACLSDKAVANALRYAAVPDTLRTLLAGGTPQDGVAQCAAQGALMALQAPSVGTQQPAVPVQQPIPQAQPRAPPATADAAVAATARAADLVARARQDAVRVALQAQEDAVELLRRQMQEAQELLMGHES